MARRPPEAHAARTGATHEILTFLAGFDDPRLPVVQALRAVMLGLGPDVREGIKWNAPSYATTDDFATMNLGARGLVRLILHTGAKAKGLNLRAAGLPDPTGLLEWLADDRCVVRFGSVDEVEARSGALRDILRGWTKALAPPP